MAQRILSVDDNEIVGWTLAARLWVAGYDVESVSSASAAFDALKDKQYDLVLMDLEMPDCGGLDALQVIVREGLCPDVPVVLLTSSEYFGDVQKAYALGARGYLTKGSASSKLIKTVDRLLKSDDVVWIDDLHCVSRHSSHDEPASMTSSSTPTEVVTQYRAQSSARHLTLVSAVEGVC